jgi:hypothetical protein
MTLDGSPSGSGAAGFFLCCAVDQDQSANGEVRTVTVLQTAGNEASNNRNYSTGGRRWYRFTVLTGPTVPASKR